MSFSVLDIFFIILVITFGIVAASHGLIKEIFGKLSFVAGAFVGFFYCGQFAPYIAKYINQPMVDIIIAFLLLFITTFLFVKIIQLIVSKFFEGDILKSLDRSLGFFFGAFEGLVVVCCIIIFLKVQTWFSTDALLNGSTFAGMILPFLDKPVTYIQGMLTNV